MTTTKTRITELLGIKYPIFQGGMAWIAEHTLASAVSNAGGLGIIAGGSAPIDYLRDQIRQTKAAVNGKPFGVNIMLMSPNADDLAQLVIDEGVPVVTTGAGNPGKYMAAWKEAGIKVIPVVPSVPVAFRSSVAMISVAIAIPDTGLLEEPIRPTIREDTDAKKNPKITMISEPSGLTGNVGMIQISTTIAARITSSTGIGRSCCVRSVFCCACFLLMLAIACLNVRIISGKVLTRLMIPPVATAPAPMYLM